MNVPDTSNRKYLRLSIVVTLALLSLCMLSWKSSSSSSSQRRELLAEQPGDYYDKLRDLNAAGDDTLYYNLEGGLAPILSVYSKGGPVIATLVPNTEKDIADLKRGLKSLKFLKGDDPKFPAPVIIFHENDLSETVKEELANCTKRPVGFPVVDFSEFPKGFNPDDTTIEFKVKGRKDWGYYQMIRFWVSGIWLHKALVPYETIMRMDSDSCFMEENPTLPKFPSSQAVYYSQYVGLEPKKEFVKGLWDWNIQWLKEQGDKQSGNPMFWSYSKNTHELHQTLPLFRTNFEVSRKSFMQKRDVAKWNEAITEQEPFGIYKHRWGDAVIRFLMASIFPQSEMVITSRPPGYAHKNLCDPEQYAKRYNKDLEQLIKSIEAEE